MWGYSAKAQVAELLAPSVEATIAKGLNEDFPDDDDCVTILPLDVQTLRAICFMNIPHARVERNNDGVVYFTEHGVEQWLGLYCEPKESLRHGDSAYYLSVTVTQCNSYVKAIKAMRKELEEEYDNYRPLEHTKLGNYALKSADGSKLIWVRYTTVVMLHVRDDDQGQ